MFNTDILYNEYVQSLFIMSFDNIKKKYDDKYFSWDKFYPIFQNLYNILFKSIESKEIIKNYYIFTFLYLNYTNYLKFINSPDFNNQEIYKMINKIKFNSIIVNNIFNNLDNETIKNIIKINNNFITKKLKKQKSQEPGYLKKIIEDYLQNTKQIERFFDMSNENYKKTLNIILFRYFVSKDNGYQNYNEFVSKKIINLKELNFLLDYETFIKKIPFSKNILNIKTPSGNLSINTNVNEIINFILKKLSKIRIESYKDRYILYNEKYDGKIIICFNEENNKSNEFDVCQMNYSFMYYNIPELKDFNFLRKTETLIKINLISHKISDYTTLLQIIHLITISIKILESYPTELYDCINPLDHTNYYFLSFCLFFEFIKPQVKTSQGLNKFVVDLLKYFYIYSYYDYYFYYSEKLVTTISNNYEYKNDIFNEFINNLKKTLKLPKELFAHPPFFDVDDDINSVIYYNLEIPNYIKFFDYINAICYVFDRDYYNENKQNFDIEKIIKKYFMVLSEESSLHTKQNSNKNINKKGKYKPSTTSSENSEDTYKENSSSIDDLKSKLDSDIITNLSKKEKKLMNNNNTYLELNIENSVNYQLFTDTK